MPKSFFGGICATYGLIYRQHCSDSVVGILAVPRTADFVVVTL